VTRALAHGVARGGRLLYKKIDSTMRGPVASELAAVATALPNTKILFTPANPHAGRTVRDGILLVNGVPVAKSEFGRDPVNPVTENSIRAAVPSAARERVIALDVTTDTDFTMAITTREAAKEPWVAVGSGALARVLVPRLVRPDNPAQPAAAKPKLPPGPVLFLCGSAHPLNTTQAAMLTHDRQIPVFEVDPIDPTLGARAAIDAIGAAGAAGLRIASRVAGAASFDSRVVLAALTRAAVIVASETGARRVMATGGETARALCDAWGISALRVLGDVEPGLVMAFADGWLMAIKPGGFGNETTWVKAVDALSATG
jgi:uncharacterized protein YgbK (DUF1537 family)